MFRKGFYLAFAVVLTVAMFKMVPTNHPDGIVGWLRSEAAQLSDSAGGVGDELAKKADSLPDPGSLLSTGEEEKSQKNSKPENKDSNDKKSETSDSEGQS